LLIWNIWCAETLSFPKNNFFKKQLISNIYFIDLTLCK